MKETDLYLPVKAHLEARGYEVKGEVGPADVVGVRDGTDMVVVELKRGFSLTLFHQAIARLSLCDTVYVAVAKGRGRPWLKSLRENLRMARRLGLGVMAVDLTTDHAVVDDGAAARVAARVKVYCDPGPYGPRKVARKRRAILAEFEKREGDPNLGGLQGPRVTAYRQEAVLCAEFLAMAGTAKGAEVAKSTGVARATLIMRNNHYGWFEKVSKGIYTLSEAGRDAASD